MILSNGKTAPLSLILTKKRVTQSLVKTVFSEEDVSSIEVYASCHGPYIVDPKVEELVHELIGRVADKWTMIILEVLTEEGVVRFTRLSEMVPGVSYKMLTQTLRQMERQGLVHRTVYPVVPPKVEYRLTQLGLSLSAAFCGVWVWAEKHLAEVETAKEIFDENLRLARETGS